MPTTNKIKQQIDYFIAGPGTEVGRAVSAETTLQMHDIYSDMFFMCFNGTFFLQVKDDAKAYLTLLRCLAYAVQEPYEKELGRPQHIKY